MSRARPRPRREVRDPCIIRKATPITSSSPISVPQPRGESAQRAEPRADRPGIALYSSKDLKAWKLKNWLMKSSELPEDCPYKNRFWAPEIHKIGGKFYLIFTADNWLKERVQPGRGAGAPQAMPSSPRRTASPAPMSTSPGSKAGRATRLFSATVMAAPTSSSPWQRGYTGD